MDFVGSLRKRSESQSPSSQVLSEKKVPITFGKGKLVGRDLDAIKCQYPVKAMNIRVMKACTLTSTSQPATSSNPEFKQRWNTRVVLGGYTEQRTSHYLNMPNQVSNSGSIHHHAHYN